MGSEKRVIRHGRADWMMRHPVGEATQNWNICDQMRPGATLTSPVNNRYERFGSSQANRVVTLGERQAAQTTLPLIMVLCADK
jgi:hypothetical protein